MFVNMNNKVSFRFLENPTPPQILITPDALLDSKAYVDLCEQEVGWLAHIKREGDKFIIDRCFLPKQEVTGSSCEFTEQGLSDIMYGIIQAESVEYYDEIRCWCHSHVNMAVVPSAQDMKQILQWKDSEYQIMIIFNKKGEAYAEFYDFKNKIVFNNLSIELYNPDKERRYCSIKQALEGQVSYIRHAPTSLLDLEPEEKLSKLPREIRVKTSKNELAEHARNVRKFLTESLPGWGCAGNRLSVIGDFIYTFHLPDQRAFFKTHALQEDAIELYKEVLSKNTLKRKIINEVKLGKFNAEKFVAENSDIMPDFKKFDLICPITTLEFIPMFADMKKSELEEIQMMIEDTHSTFF